jgi:hypothetical protein
MVDRGHALRLLGIERLLHLRRHKDQKNIRITAKQIPIFSNLFLIF